MIKIERLVADDVNSLYDLVKNVPEFLVNTDTVNFWPKSVLIRASNATDIFSLVAKNENTIVGFVLASYSDGLRKATIENIYVIPERRDQGVGNLLLNKLEQSLKNADCEYIATLIPRDALGALGLYTKAGYSTGQSFVWLDKSLTNTFSSI